MAGNSWSKRYIYIYPSIIYPHCSSGLVQFTLRSLLFHDLFLGVVNVVVTWESQRLCIGNHCSSLTSFFKDPPWEVTSKMFSIKMVCFFLRDPIEVLIKPSDMFLNNTGGTNNMVIILFLIIRLSTFRKLQVMQLDKFLQIISNDWQIHLLVGGWTNPSETYSRQIWGIILPKDDPPKKIGDF